MGETHIDALLKQIEKVSMCGKKSYHDEDQGLRKYVFQQSMGRYGGGFDISLTEQMAATSAMFTEKHEQEEKERKERKEREENKRKERKEQEEKEKNEILKRDEKERKERKEREEKEHERKMKIYKAFGELIAVGTLTAATGASLLLAPEIAALKAAPTAVKVVPKLAQAVGVAGTLLQANKLKQATSTK